MNKENKNVFTKLGEIKELSEEDLKIELEISSYRKLANASALKMKECFENSQNSFKNGDKALAKKLADEGRFFKEQIAYYNNLTMSTAFNYKNKNLEMHEIDLHCLQIDEAIKKLSERIEAIKLTNISSLLVIHGQGLHSDKQNARIKQSCYKFLDENKIFYTKDNPNNGCLTISFFC